MKELSKVGMKTVGLDLGDLYSHFLVLDEDGQVLEEGRVATRESALRKRFSVCERMRIALETGTHSPWVARLLKDCGHEVIVANSRKLRLIYENRRKNDRVDAMYLARRRVWIRSCSGPWSIVGRRRRRTWRSCARATPW